MIYLIFTLVQSCENTFNISVDCIITMLGQEDFGPWKNRSQALLPVTTTLSQKMVDTGKHQSQRVKSGEHNDWLLML